MSHGTIQRGGKTYVLLEQGEYERLTGARGALAPLPLPDASGNVGAVDFARAAIARNIVGRRQAAGLSQAALATAAGIRVETLNRLENAKHTADVATLAKIDAVLSTRTERRGPGGRPVRAAVPTGPGAHSKRKSTGSNPVGEFRQVGSGRKKVGGRRPKK